MGTQGKSTLSYRKSKQNSARDLAVVRDLKMAHKATLGDTSIDLANLSVPAELSPFTNPSSGDILDANLRANKASIIVLSSVRGMLVENLSYKVVTNALITLEGFTAADGEIFTIQLRGTSTNATAIDGKTIRSTGTLSAGSIDIATGTAFNTNSNPNQQMGDVVVVIDGDQQLRNVGNATAAGGADGNYEEVNNGNGSTSIIRMNTAEAYDRSFIVYSAGPIVSHADAGQQQEIDALGGQLDVIIPTLAALAGVPETDFQSNPNDVDLRAFGDKVLAACENITKILDTDVTTSKTCYLKDEKASNTQGGTFTLGAWRTRDLNNISGDQSFITVPTGFDLATNDNNGGTPDVTKQRFTLEAGTYDIEASAPVYRPDLHKCRLYNITDSVNEIVGSGPACYNTTGNTAHLMGRIVITAPKTFELQHHGSATRATDGFGTAHNTGDIEVYTQVKITKIEKISDLI